MWPWIGLYLEESELYTWSRRTACLRPVADVAEVLTAHRRSNYRLVVNQSREQILPETLPAMSRGMRAQFLDSRLRRLFPDTPWRSVAPAAKPAASTEITWLALSETPALRQLLAALSEYAGAVLGIYSVVQLLPPGLHASPHLLLSEHCRYLRCSLMAGGRVRASQLIAASADSAGEIRQFLARAQQGNLPVLLWGSQAWRDALVLPASLSPLPVPPACVRPLLAGIRRWPAEQFALPAQRRVAQRRSRGVTLGAASACGLLAATLTGYGCQQAEPLRLPPAVTPAVVVPEGMPEPLLAPESLPEQESVPVVAPRLDGRISRQEGVVSEWREGMLVSPADGHLAVGDTAEQPLLPPGSLRIHRVPGR